MKADTLLDYAALQLSPRETRYEVFLSGGGETEKLDQGLPKPLLEHFPAAQELVHGDGRIFKLELSENESGAPWFTKGTVERFVRFANTPELLEQVNAIRAEMAQLDNARNFNLAPYPLCDGDQTSSVELTTDGSTPGTELKSRKETALADASRSHLLRAIDVRLMTLHQELKVALARATAAGFSGGHMANLMAFSERFGPNRLREACAKFVVSCQQRQQQVSPRIDGTHKTLSGPSSKHGDKSYENTVKENQLSQSYAAIQSGQESLCSSSFTEDAIAKPPLLTTTTEGGMALSPESMRMASRGLESISSDRDDQSPPSTKRPLVRSASPRARRSASPMRRVQIARSGSRRSNASVIRSINYFPERSRPNRDSSSDSEYESAGDNEESAPPRKTESTRRFSVQDAINLFERKQRQQGHSTEEIKKNLKVESRRLSAEIGVSATCEKTVLRRWSGAGEIGKADGQSSTFDRGLPSLANGKDTCQAGAPLQSEFRTIQDRKDVSSRFSSPPKITELQKIPVDLMDKAGSQYSEGSSSPKENGANNSSAAKSAEAQGLETIDSFSNSGRHGGFEPLVKQSKSDHELNQELPEKAHQLGAYFAANESGGQAVEEPMYTGNLEEVSHRTGMVAGGKYDLEQLLQTMQNVGRDPLSNSWSNKMDFDMQILMNMVDSNHSNYEEQLGALDSQKSSDELRGRFYDQYREKREAKLREEHVAKRAEKEAKLKAMQDALERRKAEMAGKSAKSSEKRDSLVQARHQAQKLQSSKTRLPKYKKELLVVVNHEDEEEDNTNDLHESSFHKHDQKSTVSRSAPGETPSSTPRMSKDLSKTNGARKISSKSTSPATARSPAPSSSPSRRSAIPKVSNTSYTSTGRRRTTENPLTRSVPNLTDLKKENIKALPGRSGSNSNFDKSGPTSRGQIKGSGHSKSGNKASPLDVNGSRSVSQSSEVKEEKKNRRQASKKSTSGLSGIKSLPATISPEESALTSKPSFYSKVTKKSSVVPLESKPFLRKGSGIGPGVGPGVAKMKASPLDDASKTVEDEVQARELKREETVEELRDLEPSNVFEGVAEENGLQQPVSGTAETLDACGDLDTSQNNMQTIPALNEILDSSEDCLSSNCVSDNGRNNQIVSEVNNGSVSPSKRASSPCARDEGQSGKVASSSEIIIKEEHVEPSMEDALLSERPTLVDTTSTHFTASGAMGLNSELGNQTSSKSHTKQSLSQMLAADTDVDESRKKWGTAQKPILVSQQPQKDAPKGFKRLLKFGRKSRYETATTDWVSVTECDEDTEESKDPSRRNGDGLLQRGAQAKGIGPGKLSSERSYNLGGVNSFGERSHEQSPVTREEHLSGSTLPKAPRSFFSLSSFRSKGGDSKSR